MSAAPATPRDPPALVDQDTLCQLLSVSRPTVWRLRQDGLPVVYVRSRPRFDPAAVLAWLANPAAALAMPPTPHGTLTCHGCGYQAQAVCPRCGTRDVRSSP